MVVYYTRAPGSTIYIDYLLVFDATCTYILLLTLSCLIFASFPPGYFRYQSCAPIHDIGTLPTQHIMQVRHRKLSL